MKTYSITATMISSVPSRPIPYSFSSLSHLHDWLLTHDTDSLRTGIRPEWEYDSLSHTIGNDVADIMYRTGIEGELNYHPWYYVQILELYEPNGEETHDEANDQPSFSSDSRVSRYGLPSLPYHLDPSSPTLRCRVVLGFLLYVWALRPILRLLQNRERR